MRKETIKRENKTRLYAALVFLFLMIVVLAPISTGLLVHELVSVVIILPLLIHIIVSWDWIVTVSKRIFKRQNGVTRFNYIWDWLLFFVFILVSVSGFLVSKGLLPLFGIEEKYDPFWSLIHAYGSLLLMIMLGIHTALHWKWMINTFKRIRNIKVNSKI